LLAVCIIASSNYVLNELLDAPFDRSHPLKRDRPVPSGLVHVPLAYVQWLLLMVLGLGLSLAVSFPLAVTLAVLWLMGCIYNIPPLRTKDLPYLDVVSEAVNNPLRMLAGWFMVGPAAIAPASLLLSYWAVGCYFMALKRFAELRRIQDRAIAGTYRKSFRFYTPERLLVSVQFYGSAAMLFFGAFIMRYRMELILAFPLVALVMAIYLRMSFKRDSAAQTPERLHKERLLMASVTLCAVAMLVLLFVDIPLLYRVFAPTAPTAAIP
jgi:4-hydroxybenzoate polyprenyltransferase